MGTFQTPLLFIDMNKTRKWVPSYETLRPSKCRPGQFQTPKVNITGRKQSLPLPFHVKFKSEFIVFILCSTRGRYLNRLNDTDYIVKVVVCSGDFLPCSRKCWWYSFWHAFHFFIRHQATEQSNIHSQINSVAPKACK